MVYILGDISWYNDEKTCEIFDRLNGRKVLIKGNHDRVHGRIKNYFEEITDYKEIVLPGNKHIVLCHYPIVFFNKHHYGAFMFYGHVHNSHEWQMTENDCLQYCYSHGYSWNENGVELYSVLDRVSCWCCRNKNLKELKNIYIYLPEYWQRLRGLQSRIDTPMKGEGKSVFDLEERFKKEIGETTAY